MRLNLKNQLRAYLEALDITAAQLARKSGVNKSVLSDWLTGVKPRDIEHVQKVAAALGTTVDDLCFGDGISGETKHSSSDDPLEQLLGDGWIGGLFEIRLRRVKRSGPND